MNYEARRMMWIILGKLFNEVDNDDFVWMFSEDDMRCANSNPDGFNMITGVTKGMQCSYN